jgi:hypothetical protein
MSMSDSSADDETPRRVEPEEEQPAKVEQTAPGEFSIEGGGVVKRIIAEGTGDATPPKMAEVFGE